MNLLQLMWTYEHYLFTYRSRELAAKALEDAGVASDLIQSIAECFDDEAFAIDATGKRLLLVFPAWGK